MTIGAMPQCIKCKHYDREQNVNRFVQEYTCKAFPDGIPSAIYEGNHDHNEPYKGDGGIRYEPKED